MKPRLFSRSGAMKATLALCLLSSITYVQGQTDGTWNSDSAGNWSDSSKWAGGAVASGASATADFSTVDLAADRIITIDGPYTIGTLKSQDLTGANGSWTFAGAGPLTLDNGASQPVLNIVNRVPVISAPLAGTNGFSKIGQGLVTLSGDNSALSGTMDLANVTGTNSAGVVLASDTAIGGITTVNIGGSATSGQYLSLSGGVTLGSGVTINLNSQGGNSAPAGGIRSEGANTVVNTINGPLNVTLAKSRISNNSAKRLDLTGIITGGANEIIFRTANNEGIHLTHTGNNWSGQTTHSGGTLWFEPGTIPATSVIQICASDPGTLQTNGTFTRSLGTAAGQAYFTLNSGRAQGFSARGGDLTVNLGAAGAEIFFDTVTADAPSTIRTNTLVLSNATADSKLTLVNPLNLNGANRTLQVSSNVVELTGGLNGGAFSYTKTGTGDLIISAPSGWLGGLVLPSAANVTSGWLRVANSLALGPDATAKSISFNASTAGATGGIELIGGVTVNNKAITIGGRNVSSETQEFLRNVSGDNAWNGDLTITNSGGGYYIRSNAGSLSLGGTLTNAFAGAARAFTLKGAGATFLIPGTLADGVAGTALQVGENANDAGLFATLTGTNTQTGPISIVADSTLQVGNGGIVGNLGDGAVNNAGSLIFNYGTGGILDVANSISGVGSVIKKGAGSVYLNGTKTYTGTTDVQAGTLGFVNSVPPVFSPTVATGATLSLSNLSLVADPAPVIDIAGKLSIDGPVYIALPDAAPVGSYDVLKFGSITGAANLTSNYRNSTFTNTSTTSKINVSAGLALKWTGAFSTDWDLNANVNWKDSSNSQKTFFWGDPVSFENIGVDPQYVDLAGELRPASVTVNSSSTDYFFEGTGSLAGPFVLTKSGAAILTISTANSFSGGVYVNGGILQAGNNQALGANGQLITVANNASLDTGGFLTVNRDYEAVITGSGPDGSGAIVNTGADHISGFGSLTLAGDATVGGFGRWDVRPTVAGNGLVNLNGKTLTKIGSNIVAIADGSMTADGTININEGILALTRMVVSGAGSINANSGATLRFENYTSGSFSKAIGINDGTVLLTGSNLLVDGPVTLTNTGTFSIAFTRTFTVSQPVGGTGALNLISAGTGAVGVLVLQNDNTYAGATSIDTGTLRIGDRTTTGSINTQPVTLANNGTLQISRSDAMVFPNLIQGGGNVMIGTNVAVTAPEYDSLVTLTGANTFTGNVTVGSGGLKIQNANALGAGIKNIFVTNGTSGQPQFYLDGSGGNITLPSDFSFQTSSTNTEKPAIGNLAGDNIISGTITMTTGGGSTAVSVLGGSLTLNGNIAPNTSARRLILGGGGGNGVINGIISGNGANAAGLDMVGSKTWSLNGANTYTGTTVVTGGTLLVNGDQSSASGEVTVGSGAILGGIGTVGGTVTAGAGSTVAPGASIGTLTTVGPASLAGTLAIEMNATTSDRLAVGGSLDISAAALNVTVTGTPDQPAYIIASYGVLNGTFASFSGIPSGYTINYNYNDLKQIALVPGGDDYDSWAAGYPGFTNNAPGADADNDGLTNQQEYAFGLDPTSGSSVSPVTEALSQSSKTFKYTRRLPGLTGLTYIYQSSTSLDAWPEFTPVSTTSNNGNPIEEITVTVPDTLIANPKLFIRVKAN